jgi:hypothetical protein
MYVVTTVLLQKNYLAALQVARVPHGTVRFAQDEKGCYGVTLLHQLDRAERIHPISLNQIYYQLA